MRPKLHGKANASKDTCKEDSFIFKYLETLQAISEQLTAGLQQGKRRQRGESCPAQVVTRLLGKSQGATSWRHKSLSRSTRQALGSGISSRSAGESFRRCTPGTAGLLHPATAAGLHGTPWATACVWVCSVPSRGLEFLTLMNFVDGRTTCTLSHAQDPEADVVNIWVLVLRALGLSSAGRCPSRPPTCSVRETCQAVLRALRVAGGQDTSAHTFTQAEGSCVRCSVQAAGVRLGRPLPPALRSRQSAPTHRARAGWAPLH